LKITVERLPESRVQLFLEVEQERVDQSFEAAYRKMASRARVPGFRPGKAPRQMTERALGRDRIMAEALDRLVPDVYEEALKTEPLDVYAQGSLDKMELDPLRLTFIVPVKPTVTLGDYRAIRIEPGSVAVTDEEVADQVMGLRRRHAIHAPVERPCQWEDIILIDVAATEDGEPFMDQENAEIYLHEGRDLVAPGFAEAIIGASKGETREFELTFPEDHRNERARGKPVAFTVTIREVKEEELPPEDDELASMVNADEFEDLQALKVRIRSDLEERKASEESARFRAACVDALVEVSESDFPTEMVEHEINHLVQEITGDDRRQYLATLAQIGRSEEEFRETFRDAGVARVRRRLALAQLTEAEQIAVSDDEVEAEIERVASGGGDEAAGRLRELFHTPAGLMTVRNNLMGERTLARLEAIARGEAPDLPAATAESTESDKE
jgi:trigger factor